jgi:hypothetical protein
VPSGYYQKLLNEMPTLAKAVNQFTTGEAQQAAFQALEEAFRESVAESAACESTASVAVRKSRLVPIDWDEAPQPTLELPDLSEELIIALDDPPPPVKKKSSYRQSINSEHKGLFVFLVDQSRAMEQPFSRDPENMQWLASRAINDWIYATGIRVTGGSGGKEWMDVAVIGYRTGKRGEPIVESMLGGAFRARGPIPITELAQTPVRMEGIVRRMADDETDEQFEIAVDTPAWIESTAEGARPMCAALDHVADLVQEWIQSHADSFPPVVFHLASGDSTDGDPLPHAGRLRELTTSDGNVLLFNGFLASASDSILSCLEPTLFPEPGLIILCAPPWVTEMSSPVPACLRTSLCSSDSLGLGVVVDRQSLASFLEIADIAHRSHIARPKRVPTKPVDVFELSLDEDIVLGSSLQLDSEFELTPSVSGIELGDGSDICLDVGDGSDFEVGDGSVVCGDGSNVSLDEAPAEIRGDEITEPADK